MTGWRRRYCGEIRRRRSRAQLHFSGPSLQPREVSPGRQQGGGGPPLFWSWELGRTDTVFDRLVWNNVTGRLRAAKVTLRQHTLRF